MRLIMNTGHRFEIYGRVVNAGDEFEVPDNEALLWMKLGRARKYGPGRPPKSESAGRYNRADMRAED